MFLKKEEQLESMNNELKSKGEELIYKENEKKKLLNRYIKKYIIININLIMI